MKKHFVLLQTLLASLIFTGCSIVGDAVRYSIEDTQKLRAGTTIQGEGFTVRVPEDNLLLVRNSPRHGFLSLRTSERTTGADGSYNVYPFILPAKAPTLEAAWQAHVAQQASRQALQTYRVLSQRTGSWHGSAAWFHTSFMPGPSHTGGFVAASCITRKGNTYYWIVRSIPVIIDMPEIISRQSSRAERELEIFLNGIRFNISPA